MTVDGVVLTSNFGPARRLGDGWTSISAFGPLSETQIACWHAQRSRSKRCCTRPLQRHDGVDLSVSPRSPEVSIHTQTSSRHRVGPKSDIMTAPSTVAVPKTAPRNHRYFASGCSQWVPFDPRGSPAKLPPRKILRYRAVITSLSGVRPLLSRPPGPPTT